MASLSQAWSRRAEIRCALTEDWLEHRFGPGTEEEGTQIAPAAAEPASIAMEDWDSDPGDPSRLVSDDTENNVVVRIPDRRPYPGEDSVHDSIEKESRRSPSPSGAVCDSLHPPRSLRDHKLQTLLERWQQKHQQQRARQRFASDWGTFDAALGGGLPRAAVHELLANDAAAPIRTLAFRLALRCMQDTGGIPNAVRLPNTTDTTGFAHARIRAGQSFPAAFSQPEQPGTDTGYLVYLAPENDLYPPALLRLGIALRRVLVLTIRDATAAQWACESALRCPGVAAVIAHMPGLDTSRSRRLQLAAEQHNTLGLLLLTERPRGSTFAFSRLQVSCCETTGRHRTVQVTTLKLRESVPPRPFEIVLPLEANEYRRGAGPVLRRIRTA